MRKALLVMGSALGLSLGVAACDQPGTTVSNNVAGTPDGGPDEPGVKNLGAAAAPPSAPQTNADFVTALAASDLFEIEAGKLAQQKGQSSEVKGFGRMLQEEHRKSSEELKALLAKSNPPVTLPTTLPPDLQARLQQLQGLTGEQFDQRWMAEQKASHQETLALLNGYLAVAEPGPLKDHAAKATGTVQKHLNEFNQGR